MKKNRIIKGLAVLFAAGAVVSMTGCGKKKTTKPDDNQQQTGGNTDSGNTSGGNTDSGNTSGGNTEGGNTSGGNTEGGNTEGGNTEGGNTEGGNTEGGNTEGGNTEGGNTEGGNTEGGNTEGGNTEGGNTEGGNTEGGNTEGGNEEVFNVPENAIIAENFATTTSLDTFSSWGTKGIYTFTNADSAENNYVKIENGKAVAVDSTNKSTKLVIDFGAINDGVVSGTITVTAIDFNNGLTVFQIHGTNASVKNNEIFGIRTDDGKLKYRLNGGSAVAAETAISYANNTDYVIAYTLDLETGMLTVTIDEKPFVTNLNIGVTSVCGVMLSSADGDYKRYEADNIIVCHDDITVEAAKTKYSAKFTTLAANYVDDYTINASEVNTIKTTAEAAFDATDATKASIVEAYNTAVAALKDVKNDSAVLDDLYDEIDAYIDEEYADKYTFDFDEEYDVYNTKDYFDTTKEEILESIETEIEAFKAGTGTRTALEIKEVIDNSKTGYLVEVFGAEAGHDDAAMLALIKTDAAEELVDYRTEDIELINATDYAEELAAIADLKNTNFDSIESLEDALELYTEVTDQIDAIIEDCLTVEDLINYYESDLNAMLDDFGTDSPYESFVADLLIVAETNFADICDASELDGADIAELKAVAKELYEAIKANIELYLDLQDYVLADENVYTVLYNNYKESAEIKENLDTYAANVLMPIVVQAVETQDDVDAIIEEFEATVETKAAELANKKFKVEYLIAGETENSIADTEFSYGDVVTLANIPQREGMVLLGWYKDPYGVQKFEDGVELYDSVQVYGKWFDAYSYDLEKVSYVATAAGAANTQFAANDDIIDNAQMNITCSVTLSVAEKEIKEAEVTKYTTALYPSNHGVTTITSKVNGKMTIYYTITNSSWAEKTKYLNCNGKQLVASKKYEVGKYYKLDLNVEKGKEYAIETEGTERFVIFGIDVVENITDPINDIEVVINPLYKGVSEDIVASSSKLITAIDSREIDVTDIESVITADTTSITNELKEEKTLEYVLANPGTYYVTYSYKNVSKEIQFVVEDVASVAFVTTDVVSSVATGDTTYTNNVTANVTFTNNAAAEAAHVENGLATTVKFYSDEECTIEIETATAAFATARTVYAKFGYGSEETNAVAISVVAKEISTVSFDTSKLLTSVKVGTTSYSIADATAEITYTDTTTKNLSSSDLSIKFYSDSDCETEVTDAETAFASVGKAYAKVIYGEYSSSPIVIDVVSGAVVSSLKYSGSSNSTATNKVYDETFTADKGTHSSFGLKKDGYTSFFSGNTITFSVERDGTTFAIGYYGNNNSRYAILVGPDSYSSKKYLKSPDYISTKTREIDGVEYTANSGWLEFTNLQAGTYTLTFDTDESGKTGVAGNAENKIEYLALYIPESE